MDDVRDDSASPSTPRRPPRQFVAQVMMSSVWCPPPGVFDEPTLLFGGHPAIAGTLSFDEPLSEQQMDLIWLFHPRCSINYYEKRP